MKPDFELRKAPLGGLSFVAFLRVESSFPFNWHYHPEYELTYIMRSRGIRLVGDHVSEYRNGDLVFLGSNLPHTWSSEDGKGATRKRHKAFVVQFPEDYFQKEMLELPEFANIRGLLDNSSRGLKFSGAIVRIISSKMQRLSKYTGTKAFTELVSILDLLGRCKGRKPLSTPAYSKGAQFHRQVRFERILRHIDENALSDLSLGEMARVSHMSTSSFSRFFRKMARKSFIEYLNEVRIGRACNLLSESDKGIAEIGFEVGFNNLSNFNRRFLKVMRMQPREYRSYHQNE